MSKQIYFVLGGPGSGKGTFCSKLLLKHPGVVSFYSAGDLLRAFLKTDPATIKDPKKLETFHEVDFKIKHGQIVPSEVTVGLLFESIAASQTDKIMIDGFPRNEENLKVFNKVHAQFPQIVVSGLIFLNCRQAH